MSRSAAPDAALRAVMVASSRFKVPWDTRYKTPDEQAQAILEERGIAAESLAARGEPATAIARLAEEHDVDLGACLCVTSDFVLGIRPLRVRDPFSARSQQCLVAVGVTLGDERRRGRGPYFALSAEAGDGDRTRTKSLEGSCAAITPRPRSCFGEPNLAHDSAAAQTVKVQRLSAKETGIPLMTHRG